jgi:hypothetical protein
MEKTELHPALQRDGKKFLSDVYFSKEKMEGWKGQCGEKKKEINDEYNSFVGKRFGDV